MSDQRYSADLIVTTQDFAECSWKSALANEELEGYSSMWQAFSSAARKASEDDRPSHGNPDRLKSSMTLISPGSRIDHYDTLIRGAQEGYSAYIAQSKSLDKLEDIVNRI
ncbi:MULTISPECIES: DUF7380 domain-containing protein [Pseudomonas]|uniref:DUF7380 domain-containing protein n=1 Tax=Pseudomonas mosselii TaxID=78327 RepID=A0A5R8YL02_9PSED|nr:MULTISPECIES: hypothetical protein [Pseudomonas]PJI71337.1 hypothetical protein CSW00_23945 [Pseudomonas sp. MR 02]PZQ37093.1 MAG: hypothetical protein DI560_22545 [Pseudomonas putida]QNL89954.1 Uncharacterized protein PPKH_4540 [Pseudomonas putida]TLP53923.1 hypothetical protein FEM01_22430 [Pseudomonas mosselii]